MADLIFFNAGLSTLTTDNVHEMVHKVWHSMEALTEMQVITQEPDNNGHITSQEAIMDFISLLEVKCLDVKEKKGMSALHFNIYANLKHIQSLKTRRNL